MWTPAEIWDVLGNDAQADAFMAAYGVTRHGNIEATAPGVLRGKNVLEFVGDMGQRPALAEAAAGCSKLGGKAYTPAAMKGCSPL